MAEDILAIKKRVHNQLIAIKEIVGVGIGKTYASYLTIYTDGDCKSLTAQIKTIVGETPFKIRQIGAIRLQKE